MKQQQLVREIEYFRKVLHFAFNGDTWRRLKSIDETCVNILDLLRKNEIPENNLNHIAAEINKMKVKIKPLLLKSNDTFSMINSIDIHSLPGILSDRNIRLH
jgi:hypothetical protein